MLPARAGRVLLWIPEQMSYSSITQTYPKHVRRLPCPSILETKLLVRWMCKVPNPTRSIRKMLILFPRLLIRLVSPFRMRVNMKRHVKHWLNPMHYRSNLFKPVGVSLHVPIELRVFIILAQNQQCFIRKTAKRKRMKKTYRRETNLSRKAEALFCPSL